MKFITVIGCVFLVYSSASAGANQSIEEITAELEKVKQNTIAVQQIWSNDFNSSGVSSGSAELDAEELFAALIHYDKAKHRLKKLGFKLDKTSAELDKISQALALYIGKSDGLVNLNSYLSVVISEDYKMPNTKQFIVDFTSTYGRLSSDITSMIMHLGRRSEVGLSSTAVIDEVLHNKDLYESDYVVALAILRSPEYSDAIITDLLMADRNDGNSICFD